MPLTLRPFLDELTIKTTSLNMRKFDLDYIDPDPTIGDWGWAQRPYVAEIERQYNNGQPVRVIVLKARQLGISTATEAIAFVWAFIHPGTNGLIMSHQDGQSQQLFEMMKTYWEFWPHRSLYSLKYGTRRQMQWTETRSNIKVATASNREGTRGSTITVLHASEVAFWPDPETLWTGLANSIHPRHGSFVALESTANGVGNWYHDIWQAAEKGDVEYVPMFFPWFHHPAYRLAYRVDRHALEEDERDLYSLATRQSEWEYLPVLSDDEILAALAWRRWKIRADMNGDINKFHQEYPSTPEEAFLTTGNPIFSHNAVMECYDPMHGAQGRLYRDGRGDVQFDADPQGPWRIFKNPSAERRPDKYFVAGDPSETIVGDPSCIQVINRNTFEQMAVYHARIEPVAFAHQMMLAGDFFGHAMLCPEVEGGGQTTMGVLRQAAYDNLWRYKVPDREGESRNTYGWSTNYQRKMWMIGELQHLLNDRSILFHDKQTFIELINYVQRDDGTLGNASNQTHDDSVMALGIAIAASKREGLYLPGTSRTPAPYDIYSTELDGASDNVYSMLERLAEREAR